MVDEATRAGGPHEQQRLSLRRWLYLELTTGLMGAGRVSLTNRITIGLIIASILFAVIDSEASMLGPATGAVNLIELGFGIVFLLEYLARLWTCVENPRFSHPLLGRLRYATTPAALIDLLALTPLVFASIGGEAFVLRLVRLLRILRLTRIGRFSNAADAIRLAIRLRRYELAVSLLAGLALILVAAAGLYFIEGADQPDKFGSIPRALWWSISSLTVGYGDVYPITVGGRVFASVVAIVGVALIAVPTGIITAAFGEILSRADNAAPDEPMEATAFVAAIHDIIARAHEQDRSHVEINAGELHRSLGGYPGPAHRMAVCCSMLRNAMREGDVVIHSPSGGDDPSLTIRFMLPR